MAGHIFIKALKLTTVQLRAKIDACSITAVKLGV